MSTKNLLNNWTELRDELFADGPSGKWIVLRRIMATLLRAYRAQLDYEKTKALNPDAYVKFFEPFTPLSAKDRENIEKAVAVNAQIRKHLSDLKKKRTS